MSKNFKIDDVMQPPMQPVSGDELTAWVKHMETVTGLPAKPLTVRERIARIMHVVKGTFCIP